MSKARKIKGDAGNRERNDFYPTPPEGTIPLLCNEEFDGAIWEPACGNGLMADVLKWAYPSKQIITSDLIDRGYGTQADFLATNKTVDNIITNPPYSLATEFAYHALAHTTNKVALLVKVQFLESQKRYPLFKNTPLKGIYVFSDRLKIYKNGIKTNNSTMFAFSWFIWDHSLPVNHKPTIDWIFSSNELNGIVYEKR